MGLIKFYKYKIKKQFKVDEVFGLQERPPHNCPTYLERSVHNRFRHIVGSTNIIVIYGESRQGKTWMIEKYCKEQIRVGCTSDMTIENLKEAMLYNLGLSVLRIERTVTEAQTNKKRFAFGLKGKSKKRNGITPSLDGGKENTISKEEVMKSVYQTVELSNNAQVINNIKNHLGKRTFVFDNFHYLSMRTQKDFCSLLKDFNYHGIKIIIVGVWKEASRITSLASDLQDRCEHIDMGTWSEPELKKVLEMGEQALNIRISDDIKEKFVKCGVYNIGIFKKILWNFCQYNDVYETQKKIRELNDTQKANEALYKCYQEYYKPLSDRIINLARPKKKKKESKAMRQKLICSLLRLIKEQSLSDIIKGIRYDDIQKELDKVCKELGVTKFSSSNVIQELGVLHTREENKNDKHNFIPLFYYDAHNKKLLILEPVLYMIKVYSTSGLDALIKEVY